MPSVLKNFVALRKNKGDVLDPASHRTIVEMIIGILRRYDFEEFNDVYTSFTNHLLDFDDPHRVTETSFLDEAIEKIYSIYVKMTDSPVTEISFRSDIVPSVAFLELIRRIVLNKHIYNRIKNNDGSVPATVSITLSREWGHLSSPTTPVVLSFGVTLPDEDAFLAKGWNTNSTPIPVIFNADNIQPIFPKNNCVFHVSSQTPYFGSLGSGDEYLAPLQISSNDIVIGFEVKSAPSLSTVMFSLLNGVDTLSIAMTASRSVELRLNNTLLHTAISCNEGECVISLSRLGAIVVSARNNGRFVDTPIASDFNNVEPFISAMIKVGISSAFTDNFGIQELTILHGT